MKVLDRNESKFRMEKGWTKTSWNPPKIEILNQ